MIEGGPERRGVSSADSLEAVHAPILEFFPEVAKQLGGDAAGLLAQIGLSPVDAQACRVSYRKIAELLDLAAKTLDCPDFGMRLATRHCAAEPSGHLLHVMRHSRRFGDALEAAARHSYAHSLGAEIWLQDSPSEASVIMGHEILLDRIPTTTQLMEMILLCGHLSAIWLTDGLVRARRIYFRHQPVSRIASYRAYFGCEVRFDQPFNATQYHHGDLARPIVSADDSALQSAVSQMEARFPEHRPPLSALARGVILRLVGASRCTAEAAAEELHVHLRTLHRRLDEEGTCFRQLRDEVRRDLLAYYIRETDLEASEISARLGFAEQSVLTRCCRRWFNETPREMRARLRGAARVRPPTPPSRAA